MKIYMLSDYLKDKFGEKLYKLKLSSGMTCPNRDGKCGYKGCIFCTEKGSGEFTADATLSIDEQIEAEKKIVPTLSGKFIAYFQNFSNTYDTPENIEKIYTPVVLREDIAVLSIATRPDCIDDEIIHILTKLNKIKPIWVELGLQTIHNKTAKYIRRGYPLSVYTEAADKLRNAGINVITHLIIGLPGESKNDIVKSAEFAGQHSDGIKFHSLYISKGTDIASDYLEEKIILPTLEEYTDILCECVRVIPKDTVIHRLTGESENSTLIAPQWSANKINVLREINHALYDRNITQGENI